MGSGRTVLARGAGIAAPGIGAAVVVATLLTLGGCGASPDDTTCGEYASMDSDDQTSTIRSLLDEHDLDDDDAGNIRGLTSGVRDYCGAEPDEKLGDAADWCASSWAAKYPNSISCDY